MKRPPYFPAIISAFILMLIPAAAASQTADCSIAWVDPITLSSDSVYVTSPHVAIDDSIVHVCWWAFDYLGLGGHDGIQYSRSTDGGLTFSPPVTLAPASEAFNPPQ